MPANVGSQDYTGTPMILDDKPGLSSTTTQHAEEENAAPENEGMNAGPGIEEVVNTLRAQGYTVTLRNSESDSDAQGAAPQASSSIGAAPVPNPSNPDAGRQIHFDYRAEGSDAPNAKLKYREPTDRDDGVEASQKWAWGQIGNAKEEKKKWGSDYRSKQVHHQPGTGGSGLDEQISTANTAKIRDKFTSHFDAFNKAKTAEIQANNNLSPEQKNKLIEENTFTSGDIDKLVGRMSMERTGTDQAVWVDKDGNLSGHPGALGSIEGSMSKGAITTEHGPRDTQRAGAVMHQFNADMEKVKAATSKAGKLQAANKAVDNMAIMGKAYSTQHLMQPAPQLSGMLPTTNADIYTARYGQIVGVYRDKNGENQLHEDGPNFQKWVKEAHKTREREKLSAASSLVKNGYISLVHPDMVAHLKKNGNDPDWTLLQQRDLPLGPDHSQANFPPMVTKKNGAKYMTLDEMKAHNETNPKNQYHLIGPPRGMVQPKPEVTGGLLSPEKSADVRAEWAKQDLEAKQKKRKADDDGEVSAPNRQRRDSYGDMEMDTQ
jgi:hypothetical protein